MRKGEKAEREEGGTDTHNNECSTVKWTHSQPPYLINAVNQKWPEESRSFP